MIGLSALVPLAEAAGAVFAALPGAVALRGLPTALRRPLLVLPILLLAGGLLLRKSEAGRNLLVADLSCCFGLTLLALTVVLGRQPRGLTRMARAAGAGWAAITFHAVLRPAFPGWLACLSIGIILTACDFGLAEHLGLGGGPETTLVLLACATVGLALLLGTRAR